MDTPSPVNASQEKKETLEQHEIKKQEIPVFDETRIEGLEAKKRYLIDRIVELNKKIRYKEVQQKAINESIKAEGGMDIKQLKRKLRALEFKISTQAHTPKHERKFIKQMEELEKSYDKALRIEKMKNKIKLIQKDIDAYKSEILKIDLELKDIRNRISAMSQNSKKKNHRKERPTVITKATEEETDIEFTLGDLAIIEHENPKKKK